jgi:23S rRNA (adenine-N6)-dimethyltransferase
VAGRSGRWGFHRLDERWAARLVRAAAVGHGDLVLDVGAGDGVITQALLDAGARVVAVELHPRRVAILRERFDCRGVRVVRADASDLRLPHRSFKVVANPPFAVLTSVVRRLTHPASRLDTAVLVVPGWAAARWAAGRRGRSTCAGFDLAAGSHVPATAFSPVAPNDARVLVVRRRSR